MNRFVVCRVGAGTMIHRQLHFGATRCSSMARTKDARTMTSKELVESGLPLCSKCFSHGLRRIIADEGGR